MHQMRAVTLTGYLEVAASVGLDGPRMMRQAGIAPESLSNPETRLPANAIINLVERSAELSGCENFGLLMAETRSFADLGPLALLLERLPNLREIMRAASDFQRHMNDILTPSVEDAGDACLIRLDFEPGFWSVQMFDHAVAAGYRILTAATDGVWKPDCAHLVHKAPADLAPWRRVVPVPIEFDASFNGFSTTPEKMLLPNPNADETMARNARHLLRLVHVESVDSTADRVRRSIALMLPSGRATIEQIAKQLGMSARSLQRRLDDEGEQFAELLAGVRRQLATAYLADATHPVTIVASLLGYASPSSFTRWFSAEFGQSPQAWRNQHKGQEGPPPTWRR